MDIRYTTVKTTELVRNQLIQTRITTDNETGETYTDTTVLHTFDDAILLAYF